MVSPGQASDEHLRQVSPMEQAECPGLPAGGPGLTPPRCVPQELAEVQAQLQAYKDELRGAHGQQEELLQGFLKAQEREAAATNRVQALSSQLDEAQEARREVRPWPGLSGGQQSMAAESQGARWRRLCPHKTGGSQNQGHW